MIMVCGLLGSWKRFYAHQLGVDIELWAHEHEYQRMWPVYNRTVYNGSVSEPYVDPKAPVHFITGSAVSLTKSTNV